MAPHRIIADPLFQYRDRFQKVLTHRTVIDLVAWFPAHLPAHYAGATIAPRSRRKARMHWSDAAETGYQSTVVPL